MMSAHRRLLFAIILLVFLLIQVGVATEISVGRVKPDILLVATICWALLEGPSRGALFGFFGGLLEDAFTTAVMGVGAFAKTILGYVGGELRQRVISKSVAWPAVIVFFGSILHELIKFATWAMVGMEERPAFNFGIIAGMALYNALLTLVVYPVLARFSTGEERALMF